MRVIADVERVQPSEALVLGPVKGRHILASMKKILALCLPLIAACTAMPVTQAEYLPFVAAEHRGTWASRGYGYVIDASEHPKVYDVAGRSCIAEREDESLLHVLVRYRKEGDELKLRSAHDPYDYVFDRIDSLPPPCRTPAPDSPLANFDDFADFFGAHYAFFKLHNVDWPARVAMARAMLGEEPTEAQLFDAMTFAVEPLRDAHVRIEATVGGEQRVYNGDLGETQRAIVAWGANQSLTPREALGKVRRAYWFEDIGNDLLGGSGQRVANNRIQYGMAGDVGLIAIVTMGGYVEGRDDDLSAQLAALEAAMDGAIALFEARGAKAVIVDLAMNQGGHDFLSMAVASRFAATRALAFRKRAGDFAGSPEQPRYVEPSRSKRYTGPVYVLTSDATVSAGETLVLALRALPNVTHVGTHTRGAFSDVLTRRLPNGWSVGISNEVYTDPQGRIWEGRGVEPNVTLRVFDLANPLRGHTEAVREIQRMVSSRHRREALPR